METINDGNIHDEDPPLEAQEVQIIIQHSDSSCLPLNQVIDREVIDEDGDVLIQSSAKEFLVSSKILGLASPVFKAMFNSNFLEGSTFRSVQNPLKLPLPYDDPDALAVLFHTLHFSPKLRSLKLGVDLQLDVAHLSDKYVCTNSIHGESERWLRSVSESDHNTSALWKLSTIAFLMGHIDEFSNLTAKLVWKISATELDQTTLSSALPDVLKGALHRLRTRVLCDMMGEVEKAMDSLRNDKQEFDKEGKLCVNCRCWKPPPTKKCHSCRTDEFVPIYCDSNSRVCEFLGALNSANIWPLSQQVEDSAATFLTKVESMPYRLSHTCNGDMRCPLFQAARTLGDRVGKVRDRSKGLDLLAVQRNS